MPEKYLPEVKKAISTWALCVLPSSFPFMFLTSFLTGLSLIERLSQKFSLISKKLLNLPGISLYAISISLLSGYPVGAKTALNLYEGKLLSKNDCFKLCALCSFCSPTFILGSVGSNMLCDLKSGIIILLSHYAACFLSVPFLRRIPSSKTHAPLLTKRNEDNLLYESMYSSVISILCVGGFIIVFHTLSAVLYDMNILKPLIRAVDVIPLFEGLGEGFILGIIEMTGGCNALSLHPSAVSLSLICFLVTFGGASAIFQQLAYLKRAEINGGAFILIKLLQAVAAFFICLLFSTLLRA